MKKVLTASVLLNLVLLLCLLASLREHKTNTTGELVQTNSTEISAAETSTPPQLAIGLQNNESNNLPVVVSTSPPIQFERDRAQAQPILMPLVFQKADLTKLGLNHDQIGAVEDLRQEFLDAIGGPGQDPKDPAYLQKWLKNQPEIDSDLRAMIGVTAFQNYQIEAADSGTAPEPAGQPADGH